MKKIEITKEMNVEKVKLYILNAINMGEHIQKGICFSFGGIPGMLNAVYDLFIYNSNIESIRTNEKKEFINWFNDKHSCFDIEMDSEYQKELLAEWGAEDREFNDVICDVFMEMLKEYGIDRLG